MALASLILGILSIIISLGHPIFNIIGVLAGLAGVVLGYFSRRRSEKRRGIALAGMLLSILGVLLCVAAVYIMNAILEYAKENPIEASANF